MITRMIIKEKRGLWDELLIPGFRYTFWDLGSEEIRFEVYPFKILPTLLTTA